jgi:hypothetical protein
MLIKSSFIKIILLLAAAINFAACSEEFADSRTGDSEKKSGIDSRSGNSEGEENEGNDDLGDGTDVSAYQLIGQYEPSEIPGKYNLKSIEITYMKGSKEIIKAGNRRFFELSSLIDELTRRNLGSTEVCNFFENPVGQPLPVDADGVRTYFSTEWIPVGCGASSRLLMQSLPSANGTMQPALLVAFKFEKGHKDYLSCVKKSNSRNVTINIRIGDRNQGSCRQIFSLISPNLTLNAPTIIGFSEITNDDRPTIKWEAVEKATSYELKVSLDKQCAQPVGESHNATSNTSLKLNALPGDGIYYICVTAKNALESAISEIKKLQYDTTLAPNISIAAPTDGELISSSIYEFKGSCEFGSKIVPTFDTNSGISLANPNESNIECVSCKNVEGQSGCEDEPNKKGMFSVALKFQESTKINRTVTFSQTDKAGNVGAGVSRTVGFMALPTSDLNLIGGKFRNSSSPSVKTFSGYCARNSVLTISYGNNPDHFRSGQGYNPTALVCGPCVPQDLQDVVMPNLPASCGAEFPNKLGSFSIPVRLDGLFSDPGTRSINIVQTDSKGKPPTETLPPFDVNFVFANIDQLNLEYSIPDVSTIINYDEPVPFSSDIKHVFDEEVYGHNIAASGDWLAVSSPWGEAVSSNGQPIPKTGLVHMFKRSGNNWLKHSILQNAAPLSPDKLSGIGQFAGQAYGQSVAVSGDLMVVGIPGHSAPVEGSETGTELGLDGQIEILKFYNNKWNSISRKVANVYGQYENLRGLGIFGASVAIDQGIIVASHPGETDDGKGALYVYKYNEATNSVVQKSNLPLPADLGNDDAIGFANTAIFLFNADAGQFGKQMAFNQGTLVVGAPSHKYEDTNGDLQSSIGKVYVYEVLSKDDATWDPKIIGLEPKAKDVDSRFGQSVAVSGKYIAVGMPTIGKNGAGSKVYVYNKELTNWQNSPFIIDRPEGDATLLFGYSVAINGKTLVIGAREEDFDLTPEVARKPGKAYVYQMQNNGQWEFKQVLVPSASSKTYNEFFGASVGVASSSVFVGSPEDRSKNPNDPSDESGRTVGSLWMWNSK